MSAPQDDPRAAAARGEKGERGATGARGELPPELRRVLVYLFTVAAVAAVVSIGLVFYALARSTAENRAAIAHANALNRAAIAADDHKFCAVVEAATAAPVRKPPDPAATPGREATYKFYVAFLALGRSLGCD